MEKQCAQCNAMFNYEPPVGYPDKRKYCDNCSAAKKTEWDAKKTQQPSTPPSSTDPLQIKEQVAVQIIRNERANSYEYGKAGNRFKLYFETKQDLQEKIDGLTGLRLPPETD